MQISNLLNNSIQHFNRKNCSQIAAALSYYSLFAIAPIFFILFFILELFLSDIQTVNTITTELYAIFPSDMAYVIGNVIQNIAGYETPSSFSQIIGIVALVISSTTIIRELQKALNTIFEVTHPDKVTVAQRFQKRMIAFIFLVILGLLLLISFILNTVLNAVGQYISFYIGFDPFILYIVNVLLSLLAVSLLFTLLFRYLPDINLPWHKLIMGGFITGIFFIIGKNMIGYVLGHANFSTFYGTTGTILIFLIWVYYTSMIFLFGASLTYIFTDGEKNLI